MNCITKVIKEPSFCYTPTLDIVDGKLKFSCETEDVEFVWSIVAEGCSGAEASIPSKYVVSVYAKKDGYMDSETVTKELNLGQADKEGDVNNDGTVDIQDMTRLIEILLER